MSQNEGKLASARRALAEVEEGTILGIGTGSTVDLLIDLLAERRHFLEGAVSSSARTSAKLKTLGIPELDLNAVGPLPLYIDGADECDPQGRLIKGGGAALTREKIIAAVSRQFVCIIDPSKRVEVLGAERRAAVCRELTKTHEEIVRGTFGELAEWAAGGVLGEITVVVAGAQPRADVEMLVTQVQALTDEGMGVKDACARVIAANPGAPSRRELYDAVLRSRQG